jgi:hypothetical protein
MALLQKAVAIDSEGSTVDVFLLRLLQVNLLWRDLDHSEGAFPKQRRCGLFAHWHDFRNSLRSSKPCGRLLWLLSNNRWCGRYFARSVMCKCTKLFKQEINNEFTTINHRLSR